MASDHMHGMAVEKLLAWILKDLEKGSALGIVRELFFTPAPGDPFKLERYGVTLETPLGAAAGPHTQMAQNIIAAWLTGARYLELKTVQVLDTITVAKPCIDMADEGYNCEWSQELTLDQSYEEYLKAWVLIHILHDHFGGSGRPGMIFNMSTGYSMEGILSPTVQRFLDKMGDCAADVAELKKRLEPLYPRVKDLDIPDSMSDSLTISCMHGCPPGEVEKIALYFIDQRRYNTTLKMNPTLLGPQCVRGILNNTLGYEVEIPDLAFEHDLPYGDALRILNNCIKAAKKTGVAFGVKLTNTLESVNGKQNLPKSEQMVYMSGRALHPISIALAARLQTHFGGELDISFCAGLDSMNVADTLACGLSPLTICSDLLKPGGYGRLAQYIEELRKAMAGSASIDAFIMARAGLNDRKAAVIKNLDAYAEAVTAAGSRYGKKAGGNPNVKNSRELPRLDCASAPCMSACPAGQDIPSYLERVASGDMAGSLDIILNTNPFPNILGKMCNQACRFKCMRKHYDDALRIREIKGCAAALASYDCSGEALPAGPNGRKVAIIGAGPGGLSCAYFLAMAGCEVKVYDSSDKAGGAVLSKMTKEAERLERDLERIRKAGVKILLEQDIDLVTLEEENDTIYRGPSQRGLSLSLVESVGEGRSAARNILSYLGVMPPEKTLHTGGLDIKALRKKQAYRQNSPEGPITGENAAQEAARCLQCDRFCGICVSVCPNRANVLLQSTMRRWPVQEAFLTEEGIRIVTVAEKTMRQARQVVNLGDFCNECGNCAAFCPSSGAPYKAKRRLHLSRKSFDADDKGFFFSGNGLVEGKRRGEPWTLRKENGSYVFEDNCLRAVIDRESLAATSAELKNGAVSASLVHAVEAVIFASLVSANRGLRSASDHEWE